MPLPADADTVKISEGIVKTLHEIFGVHPGSRPGKHHPLEKLF